MTDDKWTSGIPLISEDGEEIPEMVPQRGNFIMSYHFCE
jgi:hypothetical protein